MAITRLGGANAITGTLPAANINNTSIGSVTALPAGVGGKILQVSDLKLITTSQSVVATSSTDLTGLTQSIIPTSTSSKIFISLNISNSFGTGVGFGISFLRDGTSVFDTPNDLAVYNGSGGGAGQRPMSSFFYIDTPSTTSEITYKVQTRIYQPGTVAFNNNGGSTFYLMEIAG